MCAFLSSEFPVLAFEYEGVGVYLSHNTVYLLKEMRRQSCNGLRFMVQILGVLGFRVLTKVRCAY